MITTDISDDIGLKEILHIVNKHKWGIISFALLLGILAGLIVFSIQPSYLGTATILIEGNKTKLISIEDIYNIDNIDTEYYTTQYEILKSRRLATKVVERLDLVNHPEFNRKPKSWLQTIPSWLPEEWTAQLPLLQFKPKTLSLDARQRGVISSFLNRLKIQPVRRSQLVKISFEANDIDLVIQIPNVLAEIYIEDDLDARLQMTQKATSWLTERLQGLRKKLELSEQKLQQFREQSHLVDLQGVTNTISKKFDEVTTNLVAAQRKRTEAEGLYRQIKGLGINDIQRLESIPEVLRHPLVQRFKEIEVEAEKKVSELSKRYGYKHPKMKMAQANLKIAKENTYKQILQVVQGIKQEYEAAKFNEQALKRELARVKFEVQGVNRKEYQLAVLERDVESNRQLYDLFLTRFKETNVSGESQSVIARVVDPAVKPQHPYKPKKKLVVILTVVLGLFFGIVLAFLLEYLDDTLKGVDDVEAKLGVSVFGILPLLKPRRKDKVKPELTFMNKNKSAFAEAIRTVRTNLLVSNVDQPPKRILITSTLSGEGKSTVAMNLAMALAQMETVLLIDADMRRPSIGRLCEFSASTHGLSNFVSGEKLSDCIHPFIDNLDVMPSGIVPTNPLELLSSKRFSHLLDELSEKYDKIVIDSPPVQLVSDAMMLAKQIDVILYVIKSDDTPNRLAKHGIKQLRKANDIHFGVTLNRVDFEKAARYDGKYGYYKGGYYGYYSYYAYHSYYGDDKDEHDEHDDPHQEKPQHLNKINETA